MSNDSSKGESDEASSDDLIEQIAGQYFERLRSGDAESQAELIEKYPEFSPHLEAKLQAFEAIYKATLGKPKSDPDEDTVDSPDKLEFVVQQGDTLSTPVDSFHVQNTHRIRCPHCGNQVQLVGLKNQEVSCGSCGSVVHVDAEATQTDNYLELPKFIGRFKVQRLLGQGAFGLVFLAEDPKLARKVALKIPRNGFFLTDNDEQRFFREAKSASRLQHPNIVRVHEISQDGDMPIIVCEYIEGLTLGDIASGRTLTNEEAVRLIVQVCKGVGHAHDNGVIHRDLKPGNIMVDNHQTALITDFGLARRDDAEITMTLDGTILGTPAYMSPEQAMGKQESVGPTSDVYAIGVILYRLLCRELPFHGTKRMLLHQVINDEPKNPRRLNDTVPKDLETITLKAMAKTQAQRFQSADEMKAELERWLRNEPILSRPISQTARAWRWCRRHPVVSALGTTIASLLIAGLILSVIWGQREAKLKLAANGNLEVAKKNKLESDSRLYSTLMLNGDQAIRDNDHGRSLFWFSQALKLQDTRNNRIRLNMLENRMPKLTNLWNVKSKVFQSMFNREGTRLAMGTDRGNIHVFDLQTGASLFEAKTENDKLISNIAFSDDGNTILIPLNGKTLQLWDVDETRQISTLLHSANVPNSDFDSTGNRVITGCTDSVARIWNASSGEKIHEYEFAGKRVMMAKFIPNSNLGIVGLNARGESKYEIRVWDYENDKLIGASIELPQLINGLDFSKDGKRFVIGSGNTTKVFDVESGTQIGKTIKLPATARTLAFTFDDKAFFVLDSSGAITTWDYEKALPLDSTFQLTNQLTSATTNPQKSIVALAANGGKTRFIWQIDGSEICSAVTHGIGVSSLLFNPDGRRVVICGVNGIVQVWDLAGCLDEQVLEHDAEVANAFFANDSRRVVSFCRNGEAYVWDVQSAEKLRTVQHDNRITDGALSQDGRMFATAGGKNIRVWDSFNGAQIGNTLEGESSFVCIAFSPEGKIVAAGCLDGSVVAWETSSGKKLFSAKHQIQIRCVNIDATGKLVASASQDGTVRVWDAFSGLLKHGPFEHPNGASFCQFMPNNDQLVTSGAKGTAFVWDLTTEKKIHDFECQKEVYSVVVSNDGERIITNDHAGWSRVWELESEENVNAIQNRRNALMYSSAFCDKHPILATSGGWNSLTQPNGKQGAAILWDTESDSMLAPPFTHGAIVRRVYFSPNDDQLLTASFDGTVRLVNIVPSSRKVDELLEIASVYSQLNASEEGQVDQLAGEELLQRFNIAKEKFRDAFSCSAKEVDNWHAHVERINRKR